MNKLFCHTRTMLPYHVCRVCSPIVQGQAPEICSQFQHFLYYFVSKLRKYLNLFLAYLKPLYTLPLPTPTPRLQGKTWKISNLAHLMKSGNLGRRRQMNGSFRSTPWQIFAKRLTERLCLQRARCRKIHIYIKDIEIHTEVLRGRSRLLCLRFPESVAGNELSLSQGQYALIKRIFIDKKLTEYSSNQKTRVSRSTRASKAFVKFSSWQ